MLKRLNKKWYTVLSVILVASIIVSIVVFDPQLVRIHQKTIDSRVAAFNLLTDEIVSSCKEITLSYKENKASVHVQAAQLLEQMPEIKETVDKYNVHNDRLAKKTRDETIRDRQASFEKQINDELNKLESALAVVADNGTDDKMMESAMRDISEAESLPEMPDLPVGELSYRNVAKAPQKKSASEFEDDFAPQVLSPEHSSERGLKTQTPGLTMTQEMKDLTDTLQTPLKVYQYVHNTIDYESYYGIKKGAQGTFETLAGNDADQAALLIAMLRYLGYDAQFVLGDVMLTAEQATDLTCANDVESAARILASSTRPTTSLASGGKNTAVCIKQVWVTANVPYGDYRGAGNASGKTEWISLDPSIKKYELAKVDADLSQAGDLSNLGNTMYSNLGKALGAEEEVERPYSNIAKNAQMSTYQIVKEDTGYLPLSLPYPVYRIDKTVSDVAQIPSDRISFAFNGEQVYSASTVQLYGKSITATFMPATDSDAAMIRSSGSIMNVPAYLVNMVPSILVDEEVVAQGNPMRMASAVRFTTSYYFGNGKVQTADNQMLAGETRQVIINTQGISSQVYARAYEKLMQKDIVQNGDDLYTDDSLHYYLDNIGKEYFSLMHYDTKTARGMGISSIRLASVLFAGYSVNTKNVYGMTTALSPGSYFVDIDIDVFANVSFDSDTEKENEFTQANGSMMSRNESTIWEIFGGYSSASSVTALAQAAAEGIEIISINKENFNDAQKKLRISSDDISTIHDYVNQGYCVIAPVSNVTIDSWTGAAYIVLDRETGSASYLISRGYSGGETGVIELTQKAMNNQLDRQENPQVAIEGWVRLAIDVATFTNPVASMIVQILSNVYETMHPGSALAAYARVSEILLDFISNLDNPALTVADIICTAAEEIGVERSTAETLGEGHDSFFGTVGDVVNYISIFTTFTNMVQYIIGTRQGKDAVAASQESAKEIGQQLCNDSKLVNDVYVCNLLIANYIQIAAETNAYSNALEMSVRLGLVGPRAVRPDQLLGTINTFATMALSMGIDLYNIAYASDLYYSSVFGFVDYSIWQTDGSELIEKWILAVIGLSFGLYMPL